MVGFIDHVLDDASTVRDGHRAPWSALLGGTTAGQPKVLGDNRQIDDLRELIDREPGAAKTSDAAGEGWMGQRSSSSLTGRRRADGAPTVEDFGHVRVGRVPA